VPLPLPAKRTFGNLQPGFVEERRLALERYLQRCLSVAEIGSCATFCHFVESDLEAADAAGALEPSSSSSRLLERVALMRGNLLKRSQSQPVWSRRFFVLCEGALHYYYRVELSNPFRPLGVIPLSTQGGASSPLLTLVPIVPTNGEPGLASHFELALHTPERAWRLAAPSAAERAAWVRALCQCGAQLSTSGAEVPEPSLSSEADDASGAATASDGRAVSGAEEPGAYSGELYKVASRVHLAQHEPPSPDLGSVRQRRDQWVPRHFVLSLAGGVLVYWQRAREPLSDASGLLPLHCYEGVAEAPSPAAGLHAFALTHASGAAKAFVLAATTAEAKAAWMARLSEAVAAAQQRRSASGDDPVHPGPHPLPRPPLAVAIAHGSPIRADGKQTTLWPQEQLVDAVDAMNVSPP